MQQCAVFSRIIVFGLNLLQKLRFIVANMNGFLQLEMLSPIPPIYSTVRSANADPSLNRLEMILYYSLMSYESRCILHVKVLLTTYPTNLENWNMERVPSGCNGCPTGGR